MKKKNIENVDKNIVRPSCYSNRENSSKMKIVEASKYFMDKNAQAYKALADK